MNAMPLVTIVIATYRTDHYLELALRDALAQTYPSVEIIVSDDANSDETRRLVERHADPRLRYRSNPHCLGAAGNHAVAFRESRGEFLAILNHDDRWETDFLAELLPPLIEKPFTTLAFCDHRIIDSDGHEQIERTEANTAAFGRKDLSPGVHPLPNLLLDQSIPMAMGCVFRKSSLDLNEFPGEAGPAYDLWLTYLLARSGGDAYYLPKRLSAWREHRQNLTSASGIDWIAGSLSCWEAIYRTPRFGNLRPAVRAKLANGHRTLARAWMKRGDSARARFEAKRALRYRPFSLKSLLFFMLTTLPRNWSRKLLG